MSVLTRLLDGQDLDEREAQDVMSTIMAGESSPAQTAALLVALRVKGETADEIAGFATAMRSAAVRVTPARAVIDVVGTGGDGSNSLNVSTGAALVAAASGASVAKHGNRSASSRCGSADVLEALGLRLELPPERIAASIDDLGFGFMFARTHHPSMAHAAPVRADLGIRTVFNILGPLTNPAGAVDGVFGVYDPGLGRTYATVLARLGARRAFVVHGDGGLDELTPWGSNIVFEVRDGVVHEGELDPRSVGIYPSDPADLAGGDATQNAALLRRVLEGERSGRRDAVVLNAAAALVAAGIASDLGDGIGLASSAIDTGAAAERLDALVLFSTQEGD